MRSLAFAAMLAVATIPPAVAQDAAKPGQDNAVASSNSDRKPIPKALSFANALLNDHRYELAAEEYARFLATNPSVADRADALYGLARAQLFLRDYPKARASLESFLQAAPDHKNAPSALFRLGEAAYLMRDLPAARQALERYVQAYPGHAQQQVAWPYLGATRYELGELELAQQALEKAISDYPQSPLADRSRYTLAKVLSARGEADRAITLLRELAARNPAEWSDRARIQLGQVQLSAQRLDDALTTFKELERTLPPNAQLADVRLRLAETLIALKRYDEAEAALQRLVADSAASDDIRAQAAASLASVYAARNEYEKALATCDSAIQSARGSAVLPVLLFRSAEALEKLDRRDQALERYKRISQEYPGDDWADEAMLNAARLALDARDFAGARRLTAEFATRFPSSNLLADARLIEGRTAQLEGNTPLAISIFESLLKLDQLNPDTRQSTLHFLSQAYKSANQNEKAAEILNTLASTGSPLAANAQFSLAQEHFEAGRFDEAASLFKKYVSDHPKEDFTANALAFLVLAAHERGLDQERGDWLNQLETDWPATDALTRVRLRLGEIALDAKKYDEAIALLRPVTQGPANDWKSRATLDLGWSYLGADRPVEAAQTFADCLNNDPKGKDAPQAAFLHAWSFEKAKHFEAALKAYEQAATGFPTTTEAARARIAQARLLMRLQRPGDAAPLLEAVLRDNSTALPETDPIDVVISELARAYEQAGESERAQATFDRILSEHPNSASAASARLQLAEAAFRDKQYDRARTLIAPLIAETATNLSDPERERATFRAARIAIEQAQFEEAKQFLVAMQQRFPEGALRDETAFWLAETHYRLGQFLEAEPLFAKLAPQIAAPTDSTPQAAWRDSATLRRIQCLVALARWSDVLSSADQVIASRPDFPQRAEIHYARGRALSSQALPDFEQARAAYQAAIDAQPASEVAARALFMTGETFMHQKDFRAAARDFHQVELLYPFPKWQAAALLESGKAYEALNQKSEATASYTKLIESFPNETVADEARKRLAALAP